MSDTIAELRPLFHSLPVLGCSWIWLAGENPLQDNPSDQHRRSRKVEREERLRLIQET